MADILAARVPTVIAANRRPIEQVWMPPLVEHRCRSGGSLPYVSACLGLLLYCDIGLYPMSVLLPGLMSPSYCGGRQAAGKLFAQERELNSREGTIAAWRDGLAAFEHALGKMLVECDTGCV
jgi:hypothetical protein